MRGGIESPEDGSGDATSDAAHATKSPGTRVQTKIKGRAWKYGDDVNTDVIFPGKYTYTLTDPKELAQHALEDLDPRFAREVKPGDIIVAGKNWGNGSSREQAVICLKEAGVGAIVARSFARIYGRNCINSALPALICAEAVEAIRNGEMVEILTQKGHKPSKDWLGLVKTSRARNKIKHVVNADERVKSIEIGEKYLEKEARRLGVQLKRISRADLERVAGEIMKSRGPVTGTIDGERVDVFAPVLATAG